MTPTELQKDWYTIRELAQRNQMSSKTVWAWIRDGKLRSRRVGCPHRITIEDWDAFLSRCNGT
jgi:excisionase family DNA binding protein